MLANLRISAAKGDDAAKSELVKVGKANSTSNRTDYMQLLRVVQNQRRWEPSLNQHYSTDPLDVFNTWLQNCKDLKKVVMAFTRRRTSRRKAQNVYGMRKRRQIIDELKYDEQKADQLIATCIAKGQWCVDPNFPTDDDDRLFTVRVDTTNTFENINEDIQEVRGEQEIDDQQATGLLAQGSMFGIDQGPDIIGLGAAPAAAVMAAAEGLATKAVATPKGKAKGKAKAKTKSKEDQGNEDEDPEAAKRAITKSPLEVARMTLAEISKQSSEAFTHAMTFENMQIAPDLVSFMKTHQEQAKNIYGKLQRLVCQEVDQEKPYEQLLHDSALLFSSWDSKEAYINACSTAANNSLKGAAKKKNKIE